MVWIIDSAMPTWAVHAAGSAGRPSQTVAEATDELHGEESASRLQAEACDGLSRPAQLIQGRSAVLREGIF